MDGKIGEWIDRWINGQIGLISSWKCVNQKYMFNMSDGMLLILPAVGDLSTY